MDIIEQEYLITHEKINFKDSKLNKIINDLMTKFSRNLVYSSDYKFIDNNSHNFEIITKYLKKFERLFKYNFFDILINFLEYTNNKKHIVEILLNNVIIYLIILGFFTNFFYRFRKTYYFIYRF